MKRIFDVALGILAAIGGFVDIGDIVFNTAAGATFGYGLLWVVVLGVGGIITYSEMCGRVAAVSKQPVFDAVRERLCLRDRSRRARCGPDRESADPGRRGRRVALTLQLLSGLPYRALILLGVLALAVVIWVLPFGWIERVFGYVGPLSARVRGRRDQAPSGLG